MYEIEKQISEKLKQEFFGPSVSVFVGHNFYPNVYVGPLSSLENNISTSENSPTSQSIDDPTKWFGMDYGQIIQMRSFLLRSKQKENIFSKSRFIEENQELALAEKPTETEIFFKKKPFFNFVLSEQSQPMGPVGNLEKMRLTQNTKIKPKVESIVRDDLKAAEAAYLLYEQNQDVYKITTILSAGILGKEKKQKLVPTRWSITATDDIVGKQLIKKIKDYSEISNYFVFQSSYMDNNFTVLMIPGSWEFENFETWAPQSNWYKPTEGKIIEEYEPYEGRKEYASLQAGGYYASRIGILEYLEKIKKQAKVVVFREIGDGYTVPLGVWQVRENVRNAMRQQSRKFPTKQEALNFINSVSRIGIENYSKKSKILNRKNLFDFVRF